MLLEALTICDFGVFRGQHLFDLTPRAKYGTKRSVILFGGLNGSGKTTILTAIRTGLYGRHSLGFGTSQKAYEDFIAETIHKNRDSLVPTNSASIKLGFTHSQLGRLSRYQVTRSWVLNGRKQEESLQIERDGKGLSELSQEQAQAFLNQLVPIGVSDLFFFDGEKISRLASDTGESTLSSSIRRLLGLDVLDKLRADLAIFARQKRADKLSESKAVELAALQQSLDKARREADDVLHLVTTEIEPAVTRARSELDRLEAYLRDTGGAWAVSREALRNRGDELVTDKAATEHQIRELLAGTYPLTLAGSIIPSILQGLRDQQACSLDEQVREAVENALVAVSKELKKILDARDFAIADKKIAGLIKNKTTSKKTRNGVKGLDLSDQDIQRVVSVLEGDATRAKQRAAELRARLIAVEHELDDLGARIAQAPAEESLADDLRQIKEKGEELGTLVEKRKQLLEEARIKLWSAIDLNRKLRRSEEEIVRNSEATGTVQKTQATMSLLDEFSVVLTRKKIEVLRQQFTEVFSRLARKEDLVTDAVIDENTFEVVLVGKGGERIPKQSLSAGEKQVYAIAMLEALAKTSGRNLPVIIDTPLGRLDSEHRSKLVNHYFPRASHQVIILSTDTEVDQSFYRDLLPHLSHAYHLMYDKVSGMSQAEEGYFWKVQEQELRHAS